MLTAGWEDLSPLVDVATWDEMSHLGHSIEQPHLLTKPQHRHRFQPYPCHPCLPAHTLLNPPSPSFNSPSHHFSTKFQDALAQALENRWASSTLEGYSCHICYFLEFCKWEQVPPNLQFPTDKFMLCTYAASDAACLSPNTIQNQLTSLKAWHNAHNATWKGGVHLCVIVNGTKNMAPSSSKLPPQLPITITVLQLLIDNLDLTEPMDAAIAVCALIAFWGQCWLGELLSSSSTNLSVTSKPARVHFTCFLCNHNTHTLLLPQTKIKQAGEKIVLTSQLGSLNPISCIKAHLLTNKLANGLPLLAFSTPSGPCALTKSAFLTRCNQIWSTFRYPHTTSHSFHIGGTTELLTAGVPPDIVKIMGQWSSDSFLCYWRDLENIAPLYAHKARQQKHHC